MKTGLQERRASLHRWHAYRREERHAPWKVLLPIWRPGAILAVGLSGPHLASLARSWEQVAALRCDSRDLDWAMAQGKSLGQEYRFHTGQPLDLLNKEYVAVVVGPAAGTWIDEATVFRCLAPGGAAAWTGGPWRLPTLRALLRHGFQSVQRYAVLPPGQGKVVIPLDQGKAFRTGLDLHRPQSLVKRFAVHMGKFASLLACQRLAAWSQVLTGRKPGRPPAEAYLLDWLARRMPHGPMNAAIYSGWTKLVLQLLDDTGRIAGIAKMADVPLGRAGILRESLALQRLSWAPAIQSAVPQFLAAGEWGGHAVQVQSAFGGGARFSPRLTRAHQQFLLALSRLDVKEGLLSDWPHWPVLWHWAHEGNYGAPAEAEALRLAIERCATNLKNYRIRFHRVHGDFTPWHVVRGTDGLAVLDWEESRAHGLPLSDAVHFLMARQKHVRRKPLDIARALLESPFALVPGNELAVVASLLGVPSELASLAIIYELFLANTAGGYH